MAAHYSRFSPYILDFLPVSLLYCQLFSLFVPCLFGCLIVVCLSFLSCLCLLALFIYSLFWFLFVVCWLFHFLRNVSTLHQNHLHLLSLLHAFIQLVPSLFVCLSVCLSVLAFAFLGTFLPFIKIICIFFLYFMLFFNTFLLWNITWSTQRNKQQNLKCKVFLHKLTQWKLSKVNKNKSFLQLFNNMKCWRYCWDHHRMVSRDSREEVAVPLTLILSLFLQLLNNMKCWRSYWNRHLTVATVKFVVSVSHFPSCVCLCFLPLLCSAYHVILFFVSYVPFLLLSGPVLFVSLSAMAVDSSSSSPGVAAIPTSPPSRFGPDSPLAIQVSAWMIDGWLIALFAVCDCSLTLRPFFLFSVVSSVSSLSNISFLWLSLIHLPLFAVPLSFLFVHWLDSLFSAVGSVLSFLATSLSRSSLSYCPLRLVLSSVFVNAFCFRFPLCSQWPLCRTGSRDDRLVHLPLPSPLSLTVFIGCIFFAQQVTSLQNQLHSLDRTRGGLEHTLTSLKKEFASYRDDRLASEKALLEQLMKAETTVTVANMEVAKLKSQASFWEEKSYLVQSQFDSLRKEADILRLKNSGLLLCLSAFVRVPLRVWGSASLDQRRGCAIDGRMNEFDRDDVGRLLPPKQYFFLLFLSTSSCLALFL